MGYITLRNSLTKIVTYVLYEIDFFRISFILKFIYTYLNEEKAESYSKPK